MLHAAQDIVSFVNYAAKYMMISSLVLVLAKKQEKPSIFGKIINIYLIWYTAIAFCHCTE